MSDVLNCPHCGEEPTENAIEPHSHAIVFDGFKMPDHTGSHVIECACGAAMIDDTREAVLRRWNRRITPAAVQADGGDARDAARYRWLREQSHPWGTGVWLARDALDAAVDAARTQGQPAQGEPT